MNINLLSQLVILAAEHESDTHHSSGGHYSGGPVSGVSMMFDLLLMLTVFLPIIPFLIPLFYFRKASKRWTPKSSSRAKSTTWFEVFLMTLGAAFVAFLWVYRGSSSATPLVFTDEYSAEIQAFYKWGLSLGAILLLVSVVIARSWNTSMAAALLLCFGFVGATTLNAKISNQRTDDFQARHMSVPREGVELPPVKMQFKLMDDIPGAKLWMNDVYLGTTPYETTAQELFEKVTGWDEKERRKVHDSRIPGNQYERPQGGTINQWGWFPVHLPQEVRPEYQVYFRVELNGVSGYSQMASTQHDGAHDSPDTTHVVALDTVFPLWEESIETLLDQLRVNEYKVTAQWLEAFDSYGAFAEKQLQDALRTEPELKVINEFRAKVKWNFADVDDADSAWDKLMKISAEAGKVHHYDSRSVEGIAVDLLVPMLDQQRLVDHAVYLLKNSAKIDPGARSYGPNRFATHHDNGEVHGEEVALWPIAHAVWRLDQRLDAEREANLTAASFLSTSYNLFDAIHPESDNLVERQLTPVIMQLSYTHPHRLDYAAVLGGSMYEEFLLRNDWRTPGTDASNGVHIGNFQNYVNKWYAKLMNLRSPLGTAFRQHQADKLVKIARGAFNEHSMYSPTLPNKLEFLFIDREFTKRQPSLAMKFWPYLNGLAKAAPSHSTHQVLDMRWSYLGRIWPESTPEMFLDALREGMQTGQHLGVPNFEETIPVEDRFEILTMLIAETEKRAAKLPEPGENESYNGPKYWAQQVVQRLQQQLMYLNAKPAAELLIGEMQADPKSSWWKALPGHMLHNKDISVLLAEIVACDHPKIQKMAIPPILIHPTPERRALLNSLLASGNEEVRTAAEEAQQQLTKLAQVVVPKRSLEQLTQAREIDEQQN